VGDKYTLLLSFALSPSPYSSSYVIRRFCKRLNPYVNNIHSSGSIQTAATKKDARMQQM
jgi:hypothetical protein